MQAALQIRRKNKKEKETYEEDNDQVGHINATSERLRGDHITMLQLLQRSKDENEYIRIENIALKDRIKFLESSRDVKEVSENHKFSELSVKKEVELVSTIEEWKLKFIKVDSELKTSRVSSTIAKNKLIERIQEQERAIQSNGETIESLHAQLLYLQEKIKLTELESTQRDIRLSAIFIEESDFRELPVPLPSILCENCSTFNRKKSSESVHPSIYIGNESNKSILSSDREVSEKDLSIQEKKQIESQLSQAKEDLTKEFEEKLVKMKKSQEDEFNAKISNHLDIIANLKKSLLDVSIEKKSAEVKLREFKHREQAKDADIVSLETENRRLREVDGMKEIKSTVSVEFANEIKGDDDENVIPRKCDFEEFVKLKREIKLLKLEIANIRKDKGSSIYYNASKDADRIMDIGTASISKGRRSTDSVTFGDGKKGDIVSIKTQSTVVGCSYVSLSTSSSVRVKSRDSAEKR